MLCLKVSLLVLGCCQPCQGSCCHALPCIHEMLVCCTGSLSHCWDSGRCCNVPMSFQPFQHLPSSQLEKQSPALTRACWETEPGKEKEKAFLRKPGWHQGLDEFPGIWMFTRCCLGNVLLLWSMGWCWWLCWSTRVVNDTPARLHQCCKQPSGSRNLSLLQSYWIRQLPFYLFRKCWSVFQLLFKSSSALPRGGCDSHGEPGKKKLYSPSQQMCVNHVNSDFSSSETQVWGWECGDKDSVGHQQGKGTPGSHNFWKSRVWG